MYETAPEPETPPEPQVPVESQPSETHDLGEAEDTINAPAEPINVNEVGYDELRRLGLSVTQTGRVLAFRERSGGFASLDDLDEIPGFPSAQLQQMKRHLKL
jgi:DNA uptake protein ComE-like DNA-binding protein